MKTKLFLIIPLVISFLKLGAQENKNRLSFEFGYGINGYSMGKLNEFYIDSFAAKPNVAVLKDKITTGQQFRLGLYYKPIGLFDFGLYGSYQYGNSKNGLSLTETNEFGLTVQEHIGTFKSRTEAISAGISTTWYISHLLKFQKKQNFLSRLHIGVELNGGIGFSKIIFDTRFPTLEQTFYDANFSSQDFQGQGGIKVEYDFTKSPIFTTLGIRFGYQYFRTQTLKDRLNRDWVVNGQHPINLDFSGLYFGTYLKIGK